MKVNKQKALKVMLVLWTLCPRTPNTWILSFCVFFFFGKLCRCFQTSRCSPWYNPNNSVSHFIKRFSTVETQLELSWKFSKGREPKAGNLTYSSPLEKTCEMWPRDKSRRDTWDVQSRQNPTIPESPWPVCFHWSTQLREGASQLTVLILLGHAG